MARRQSTFRKQHVSAEYGYTVIYERLLEGGYQVIVPALPGIVTYGRTLEEARECGIGSHLLPYSRPAEGR